MSCIKEKKFLWWTYKKVQHRYKIHSISKFTNFSNTFDINYVCECGAKDIEKFVTQDDLILKGFKADVINSIKSDKPYIVR